MNKLLTHLEFDYLILGNDLVLPVWGYQPIIALGSIVKGDSINVTYLNEIWGYRVLPR